MRQFELYRRRLIPKECILLKDDHILSFEDNRLVTVWNALKPKKELHHGISCFFFDDNIKLSKFYRADGSLIYWYIDIISADVCEGTPSEVLPYHAETDPEKRDICRILSSLEQQSGSQPPVSLVVTDLLADILIYPDGFVKVVDLGEISDALEKDLLGHRSAATTLQITDRTLECIYRGDFKKYQEYVEKFE
ncbi:MAG: DUF402 domain-containing protein [Lachnospiraceae bacterium]|nr:DUF402 domain-containing protein [Lachnospiraceae bacterium]